tara:strand:- start:3380 stop:4204 length:825 start_codon:yes stop_codon:yes gene_type:complete
MDTANTDLAATTTTLETPYLYTIVLNHQGPPAFLQRSIGLLTDRCQVVHDIADITHPSPVLILFQSTHAKLTNDYFALGFQQIRVFYQSAATPSPTPDDNDESAPTPDESTEDKDVSAPIPSPTPVASSVSPLTDTQLHYFTYNEIYDNVQFIPGLNPYYLVETLLAAYYDYSSANTEITSEYAKNFVYALEHSGDPTLCILQIGTSFNGYEQITKMSYIGKGIKIGEKKIAVASADAAGTVDASADAVDTVVASADAASTDASADAAGTVDTA